MIKKVLFMTPEENSLNLSMETKVNVSFFFTEKIQPTFIRKRSHRMFLTLQSLRPMCSLPGTKHHFKSLGLEFEKITDM